MNKTNWFNKIGKLILILIALLTTLTIFLPVIALPNEVASLVDYKGIDVVFGKEIGMILFSGVYYSNAIINPTIMNSIIFITTTNFNVRFCLLCNKLS